MHTGFNCVEAMKFAEMVFGDEQCAGFAWLNCRAQVWVSGHGLGQLALMEPRLL